MVLDSESHKGLQDAWVNGFPSAMIVNFGALKDGDEFIVADDASLRLLERIYMCHESIAGRVTVEAFLVGQLWSWWHAGHSSILQNTTQRRVVRRTKGRAATVPAPVAWKAERLKPQPIICLGQCMSSQRAICVSHTA